MSADTAACPVPSSPSFTWRGINRRGALVVGHSTDNPTERLFQLRWREVTVLDADGEIVGEIIDDPELTKRRVWWATRDDGARHG